MLIDYYFVQLHHRESDERMDAYSEKGKKEKDTMHHL